MFQKGSYQAFGCKVRTFYLLSVVCMFKKERFLLFRRGTNVSLFLILVGILSDQLTHVKFTCNSVSHMGD
jgi:hypothetical protein